MGRDVSLEDTLSDDGSSDCGNNPDVTRMYPLRPSLFPNVPPYVHFIPVAGTVEFVVEPPPEMREMLWLVPSAPWHTISNCADLNGFTVTEVTSQMLDFLL